MRKLSLSCKLIMEKQKDVNVKKFGGTSVANKERIFNVANRCIEEYRKGNDVVVVLSAMGKYTDELITMAKDINEKPPKKRDGYALLRSVSRCPLL